MITSEQVRGVENIYTLHMRTLEDDIKSWKVKKKKKSVILGNYTYTYLLVHFYLPGVPLLSRASKFSMEFWYSKF